MLNTLIFENRTVVDAELEEQENLAYVVHDMRSVTTSVSLMVDLLELAAKAGDDDVQRARAVSAQNACQQLAQLCLEAEKHLAGRDSTLSDLVRFDLADLLDELHSVFSPIFELAGKSLELSIQKRSIYVNSDRSRIMRAISNLIDNALKHTSKGSAVVVSCSRILGQAMVSVTDNGPGVRGLHPGRAIPLNTLPVVLRHISNSGAIFSPGTGLRYVTETMASLNGESRVEINEQGGSSFDLVFPKHRVGS